MLAKCANPQCSAPFHSLQDGRIFQLELDESGEPLDFRLAATGVKKPAHRERFWLCPQCAPRFTLIFQRGKGLAVAPVAALRAAAS